VFERTAAAFAKHADFAYVYISEAHSVDGWHFNENVCRVQPRTLEERVEVARGFGEAAGTKCPFLVDDMTNFIETEYRAWPERVFVLEDGRVTYRGYYGPMRHHAALNEVDAILAARFERQ